MTDMNDSETTPAQLEALQATQQYLRQMLALVDSHMQEIDVALQRKRAHLESIATYAASFALARCFYEQASEQISGNDYLFIVRHIEQYRTKLTERLARLAQKIDDLRYYQASL